MENIKKVKVLANGFIESELQAKVEVSKPEALLLRLSVPLNCSGSMIEYLVARTRYEDSTFEDQKAGHVVV